MVDSLGKLTVTTAGTLLRVTSGQTDPTARFVVHAVLFQAWRTNAGRIYVGKAGFSKTTGTGLLGTLAIPTNNTLPTFSMALTLAPAGIRLDDLWLDADTDGEGCSVSVIIT